MAREWSSTERTLNNHLEPKTTENSLKAFEHNLQGHLVMMFSNKTTTVMYVNKQGVHIPSLCQAVSNLLLWTKAKDISIKASHIAGKQNIIADTLSRGISNPNDWI